MRIERLNLKDVRGVDHARLWLDDGESPAAVLGPLKQLRHDNSVSLELFDVRPQIVETIRDHGIETQTIAGRLVIPNVDERTFAAVLDLLAADSFGAWLVSPNTHLGDLLKIDATQQRAESLPQDGSFLIFSLYDANVEIFSKAGLPSP